MVPCVTTLPKTGMESNVEQFHRRLRNWYWHSSMASWAPRRTASITSTLRLQICTCLWMRPRSFSQVSSSEMLPTDDSLARYLYRRERKSVKQARKTKWTTAFLKWRWHGSDTRIQYQDDDRKKWAVSKVKNIKWLSMSGDAQSFDVSYRCLKKRKVVSCHLYSVQFIVTCVHSVLNVSLEEYILYVTIWLKYSVMMWCVNERFRDISVSYQGCSNIKKKRSPNTY